MSLKHVSELSCCLSLSVAAVLASGCQSSAPPTTPVSAIVAPAGVTENVDQAADAFVQKAAPAETAPAAAAARASGASNGAMRETAKPVVGPGAEIPAVLLTASQKAECVACVGDALPDLELPTLEGKSARLQSLFGHRATVVLFWSPEQWTSRMALADVGRDIAEAKQDGVAVVGIGVGPSDAVQGATKQSAAAIAQLVDAEGASLEKVGSALLPRLYVLDAQQKIVWFDIDYSETTRRELNQTIAALVGAKP
jgi:peroxiredoxin